jgi:hypothetical protein
MTWKIFPFTHLWVTVALAGVLRPYWELGGGQNKGTPKNNSPLASRLMILLKNKNEQVLVKGAVSTDWILL